jgi:chromosomal replication initiation ATPase DnaA
MYFDEQTISRGLDELAVKWNSKQQKFTSVRVPSRTPKVEPPKPVLVLMKPLSLHGVRGAVLEYFGMPLEAFLSEGRGSRFVQARQVFFYISRKHVRHSFPHIAQVAGRKDHSTVIHGYRKISHLLERGFPEIVNAVVAIERALGV